jgi:hypothetical protein
MARRRRDGTAAAPCCFERHRRPAAPGEAIAAKSSGFQQKRQSRSPAAG